MSDSKSRTGPRSLTWERLERFLEEVVSTSIDRALRDRREPPPLLTMPEAARLARISPEVIEQSLVPFIVDGRTQLYFRDDVLAWVRTRGAVRQGVAS